MHSTTIIHLDPILVVEPKIKGFDDLNLPAFSFLVSDGTNSRHILFDLGMHPQWKSELPPHAAARFNSDRMKVEVEKDVRDILEEAGHTQATGITSKDIDAIIWSHHHTDHTGDVTSFPSSTNLVVGPGFKKEKTPAYPTDPESLIAEKQWAGRQLHEIDFQDPIHGNIRIGRCDAFDYFGDGSFYLLDTPGHTVAHICGLARTSTDPDTFIFMGGDACHHGGEYRPTPYLPLPALIPPPTLAHLYKGGCPGHMLETHVHRNKKATEPFLTMKPGFPDDFEQAQQSIEKLEEFDADPNVFVIIAHDTSLKGQIPFFPETINEWKRDDLDAKNRWRFVESFEGLLAEAKERLQQ